MNIFLTVLTEDACVVAYRVAPGEPENKRVTKINNNNNNKLI